MTEHRIRLIVQALKVASQQPRLLQKLELRLDVCVNAHKHESRIMGVPICAGRVGASDAPNSVSIGDADLNRRIGGEAVSRVGATNMRAQRAAQAVRIDLSV